MVGDLMAVLMIGVHQINDVVMRVAMFFNLGMMRGDDLCDLRDVMRHGAGIAGQENAHCQYKTQYASQEICDLPRHCACSHGSWPTSLQEY